MTDLETLRLTRVCAWPREREEADRLAAFLATTDADALAIIVLTRLAVDGVIA